MSKKVVMFCAAAALFCTCGGQTPNKPVEGGAAARAPQAPETSSKNVVAVLQEIRDEIHVIRLEAAAIRETTAVVRQMLETSVGGPGSTYYTTMTIVAQRLANARQVVEKSTRFGTDYPDELVGFQVLIPRYEQALDALGKVTSTEEFARWLKEFGTLIE